MKTESVGTLLAKGFGWKWTDNGAIVCIATNNGRINVFVPLSTVWVHFDSALREAGYREVPQVGAYTVGGLFSKVKRATRKLKRRAKKAVKKATRKVERTAFKTARHANRFAKRYKAPLAAVMPVPFFATEAQRKYGRNPIYQQAIQAAPPLARANQAMNRARAAYNRGQLAAALQQSGQGTPRGARDMRRALAARRRIARLLRRGRLF